LGIPRSDSSNLLVESVSYMSRDSAAHADWCISSERRVLEKLAMF